jgi:hypothetical protein
MSQPEQNVDADAEVSSERRAEVRATFRAKLAAADAKRSPDRTNRRRELLQRDHSAA